MDRWIQFPYEIKIVEQSKADVLMRYFTGVPDHRPECSTFRRSVDEVDCIRCCMVSGGQPVQWAARRWVVDAWNVCWDCEERLLYFHTAAWNGEHTGFVRVGPKAYFLPQKYKDQAPHIFNLPLRSSDVFVASYPRSGSTWIRELVWMVANNFNYAESFAVPLAIRFVFLEFSILLHEKRKEQFLKENNDFNKNLIELIGTPGYERLASTPSPRFIYTHLPLSLLPPALMETSKVVYIARDPRDVVVSFYHMNRLHRALGYVGDFKTFWNFFINDCVNWTPFFENLKEAWEKRRHPNMLFLFYEEVAKDLPSAIRRVSSFLNKHYTEEQLVGLCEHLSIDSFRKNKSVNYDVMKELGILVEGEQPYIRKGKSGGWRDYFDEEMQQQADSWIAENLRDTDLHFSTINKRI